MHRGQPDAAYLTCYVFLPVVYLQVLHYHASCISSCTWDNQTQYVWHTMYFSWLFSCRLYIIMHRGQPDWARLTSSVYLVVKYDRETALSTMILSTYLHYPLHDSTDVVWSTSSTSLLWVLHTECQSGMLLGKAKRQYMLTCKVSRYCLLVLQGRMDNFQMMLIVLSFW